ncbi:hypothetical protein ElyMa_000083800 [Elysia marginata]|uniref:Uncharacterized protein n=1 Tax=Elysia marginata TaxID=1093978 RepID=A0AAV4EJH3_9GAST|nr:hypothetical protein ElyMa_000083800 [Elysia marginata]
MWNFDRTIGHSSTSALSVTVKIFPNDYNSSTFYAYFYDYRYPAVYKVYQLLTRKKEIVLQYTKDVMVKAMTAKTASFTFLLAWKSPRRPEMFFFEDINKAGQICDEGTLCDGRITWTAQEETQEGGELSINITLLEVQEMEDCAVYFMGETIQDSRLYKLKLNSSMSGNKEWDRQPNPEYEGEGLSKIAISAIFLGSFTVFLLVVMTIQLVRSRWIQTAKGDSSSAPNACSERRLSGGYSEFSSNRASGVYQEPEDKESDYESLPEIYPANESASINCKPEDLSRNAYDDFLSSRKRMELPQRGETRASVKSKEIFSRTKSCDYKDLNRCEGYLKNVELDLRPRSNSYPAYNKKKTNTTESETTNTSMNDYERLQVACREDTQYETFAHSASLPTGKTPATFASSGNKLQTAAYIHGNGTWDEDEPAHAQPGDGDYLTVLEVDEEPVVYLELREL